VAVWPYTAQRNRDQREWRGQRGRQIRRGGVRRRRESAPITVPAEMRRMAGVWTGPRDMVELSGGGYRVSKGLGGEVDYVPRAPGHCILASTTSFSTCGARDKRGRTVRKHCRGDAQVHAIPSLKLPFEGSGVGMTGERERFAPCALGCLVYILPPGQRTHVLGPPTSGAIVIAVVATVRQSPEYSALFMPLTVSLIW
jgi:hypothetical protein